MLWCYYFSYPNFGLTSSDRNTYNRKRDLSAEEQRTSSLYRLQLAICLLEVAGRNQKNEAGFNSQLNFFCAKLFTSNSYFRTKVIYFLFN